MSKSRNIIDLTNQKMFMVPGCSFTTQNGSLNISGPNIHLSFECKQETTLTIFQQLASKGITIKEIEKFFSAKDTKPGKEEVDQLFNNIHLARLICFEIELAKGITIIWHPSVELDKIELGSLPENCTVSLTEFTALRNRNQFWRLESPLANGSILFNAPVFFNLVGNLGTPQTLSSLAKATGLSKKVLGKFLELLIANQFIRIEENERALGPLDHWEYHDLYFHTAIRKGRSGIPLGAFYRFEGITTPPPVVKEPFNAPFIFFPPPNTFEYISHRNPDLNAALENRTSIRQSFYSVITIEQLGEFLFRSARVRQFHPPHKGLQVSSRPYPSGGASYELEIYLTVNQCMGLQPGFYHYDPVRHGLSYISQPNHLTQTLLHDAQYATANYQSPQVLITLAARFQRVSWKYNGIAYGVIMKNTGALYQTFYLVATAMGLGPCGLGYGDSEAFNKLTGIDRLEESSVGEFWLGGV